MIYAPSCFFSNQVSGFVDRQFICHIQFNKAFTQIPKLCCFLQIAWRLLIYVVIVDGISILCHKNSQQLEGEVKH